MILLIKSNNFDEHDWDELFQVLSFNEQIDDFQPVVMKEYVVDPLFKLFPIHQIKFIQILFAKKYNCFFADKFEKQKIENEKQEKMRQQNINFEQDDVEKKNEKKKKKDLMDIDDNQNQGLLCVLKRRFHLYLI